MIIYACIYIWVVLAAVDYIFLTGVTWGYLDPAIRH